MEGLRRDVPGQGLERREVIADHRGKELVVRRLFEGAAQTFAQRRALAVRRQRPAELGKAAVPERLRGADHRRIAGAELFGQCRGREERRLGTEIEQKIGDPAFRGCERPATFGDAVGVGIRSACY